MKKLITLTLALAVLATFNGLAIAGTTVKGSKSNSDNIAVDKSSPKLMPGKVTEVNNQAKTFTVMAKGKAVIEVKVGEAKDSAVGQIARYLGWYAKSDGKPPRGMLVAAEFPQGVRYAANAIPNLTLHAYRISFAFEQATI